MKRKIITTADGSTTIQLEEWEEQYHSVHGAIQEAKHVFVKYGLHHVKAQALKNISILEIGFGTGLNAYISALEAEKLNLQLDYVGVEAYPVVEEEIALLNYSDQLQPENSGVLFQNLHECSWEEKHVINFCFSLTKQKKFFKDITAKNQFHLIYFDAFGAKLQPELWNEAMFKIMYEALLQGGVLVTYSAKGSVRRAMQAVGFAVERLPGPPGKREMLRATKA